MGVAIGRAPGFDDTLDELALLAESAGDIAVARVIARRKSPDPALFIGTGKADEIKALVEMHGAEVVLFDQALGAAQQRNLERHLGVAVADRTMLILEIFADRAQSHEPRRFCPTNTSRTLGCGIRITISASSRKPNASAPDGNWRTSIARLCCGNRSS